VHIISNVPFNDLPAFYQSAEIFVYSPDKLKRNLVRMLEASLYTLKLPAEKVQGEIPMGDVTREEQTNK
jgi:hypothetical protein